MKGEEESMTKLTVLMDNTVGRPRLLGEWVLSLLLEHSGQHVLIDTGESDRALANAERLGCLPPRLTAIVLSHGHYDHSGGLLAWLRRYPGTPVHAHPDVLAKRYAIWEGRAEAAGLPHPQAEIEGHGLLRLSAVPVQVGHGLTLTGQVSRRTGYEDTGGSFYFDPQGREVDPIADDQALVVDLGPGLAVITGCAHSGVVNTLHQVAELFPGRPVLVLVGGFHLLKAAPERVDLTIAELKARVVGRLATGHCTGPAASARLAAAFPGRFVYLAAGVSLELPEAKG
jgi:7,8-dihydropterin-6-yl-methyl-4-(beta-D-ribofuranosyl)aminobenzene 5'-phosphate synthase